MIIAAWKRGLKPITEDNTMHIYNCSSHDVKQINLKNLIQMAFKITEDVPLDKIIWSPATTITKNPYLFYILVLIMHILPAFFIDRIMKLFGARPMLLKLQRKIYCANNALSYFLTNVWTFHNEKLINLFDDLSAENKEYFGFAYRDFNIEHYFRNGLIGAKIYLLNEDMNQLEAARYHRKRMDWLNRITTMLFVILILWIFYRSNTLSYITNFFIPR
ncbi:Fatty acyl-CoA reductase [Camponotus japonicus]